MVRLTEVFVIKEAPKKMTFQQLKQKNPQAAKEWEDLVADHSDGQDDPNEHTFQQDGLKITTDAGGGYFWDPVKKYWELPDNVPGQAPVPPGSGPRKV